MSEYISEEDWRNGVTRGRPKLLNCRNMSGVKELLSLKLIRGWSAVVEIRRHPAVVLINSWRRFAIYPDLFRIRCRSLQVGIALMTVRRIFKRQAASKRSIRPPCDKTFYLMISLDKSVGAKYESRDWTQGEMDVKFAHYKICDFHLYCFHWSLLLYVTDLSPCSLCCIKVSLTQLSVSAVVAIRRAHMAGLLVKLNLMNTSLAANNLAQRKYGYVKACWKLVSEKKPK